jgi:hypothetical protein
MVYVGVAINNFHSKMSNLLGKTSISRATDSHENAEYVDMIKNIVSIRAGSPQSTGVIWHHSGVMRNPLTGAEVVGIEGIEFTSSLPFYVKISNISDSSIDSTDTANTNARSPRNQKKTSKGTAVRETDVTNTEQFSQSFLSQKLFVYVDAKNRSKAIESHRIHPIHSPARAVQPMKELNQMVTLGINQDSTLSSELQFPAGRTVRSSRIKMNRAASGPKSPIEIGLDRLWSLLGVSNPAYEIIHFMSAHKKKSFNSWVSFQSPANDISGRSQEYYTLQMCKSGVPGRDQPSAKMTYRRYGECPPWYSIGKASSIELSADRYDSLEDVPQEVLSRFLGYDQATPTAKGRSKGGSRSPSGEPPSPPTVRDFLQHIAVVQGKPTQAFFKSRSGKALMVTHFNQKKDLLDSYMPWYSKFRRRKEQLS